MFAGAARSSASSSWVRSRSCASSTSRFAQRAAPRRQRGRVRRQVAERPDHEVVEVDAAELRDRALVGDERAGDRAGRRVAGDLVGRHPEVQLEPREGEVEASAVRGAGVRVELAQQRIAVDERVDGDPGAHEHLASEGVERAHADRAGRQPQRRERRIQPRRQLLRGTLVERDDADGRGVRPAVHEPGHAGDERRGLPGAGWRDAQDRPGRRRRRGALVRGQPAEPFGDRGMAGRWRHAGIVARTAYPPLIGPADRIGWLRNCKENANFTIR